MINVLSLALPLVGVVHPNVKMTCRRYKSHTVDEGGVVQAEFEEFTAVGQIQPVAASKSGNGQNIDVSKRAMNVWIQAELHTVESQPVADQIVYGGKVWNVETVTNWNPGNGWGTYTIVEDKYKSLSKEEKIEGKGGLKW